MAESKKVLLAEDEPSVRSYLKIILERAGYRVQAAEDGLQALSFALEDSFDVIVADAIMPNMTGYDLLRMIKGNHQTAATPFVLLSGYDSAETAEKEQLAARADVYLSKGDDIKDRLTGALRQTLACAVNIPA
jgi:CheY-like chemotaxis protein